MCKKIVDETLLHINLPILFEDKIFLKNGRNFIKNNTFYYILT